MYVGKVGESSLMYVWKVRDSHVRMEIKRKKCTYEK